MMTAVRHEERVVQGCLYCYPLAGLQLQHLYQEIHGIRMTLKLRAQVYQILIIRNLPLRKIHAHLLKITYSLPGLWCRRTKNFENLEELVNLALALEKGLAGHHFEENAAQRPHVNARTVYLCAQHHFWCSVPECHHLVGVALKRKSERACQAKVSQLDGLLVVTDEDIAWLDVPVHDATLVAVEKCFHDLLHIVSSLIYVQWISTVLHVFFQIGIEELEDQ